MSDYFGASVASLGDLDGDGICDLAVGAWADDDGGLDQGAVWILFLEADGTVKSEQKISAAAGGFGGTLDSFNTYFGVSVCSLGDLDRDGIGDLAVGAVSNGGGGTDGNGGAVWILFLDSDGTVKSEQRITEGVGGFSGPIDDFDFFGVSVAPLDDLDGDGIGDLAVGARNDGDGGLKKGALWILFLDADGTAKSEQKISETAGGFDGVVDAQGWFGNSVCSLGDLDSDGISELAVGAPIFSLESGAGAVWVLALGSCLRLDFENEDDFVTALVNGQDISTPPEFGNLVAITTSGPNAGAAIFDSTPGGPNDPSQDRDLLVGSGKIMILQTDANTTQTMSGVFDRPNDDEDGGTFTILFTGHVEPRSLELVDIDSGPDETSSIVLTDKAGRIRVFTIPPGWTGDLLVDGVGRRTLDLTSLAPQQGFSAAATAVQDAGFATASVSSLVLHLGSSGAIDNLAWLPSQQGARKAPVSLPRPKSEVSTTVRDIGSIPGS